MKTKEQIEKVLMNFDAQESNFRGMTYEQGIEEALMWVIGDIPSNDFKPASDAGV